MKNASGMESRLREAVLAGLIAVVLWFGGLTSPLDQLVWAVQSRIASFEASGDIVFIGSDEDLADPRFPERRRELAQVLNRLAATGAERVYVDVVFDRRSDEEADESLRDAMEGLGARLYLVQSYETAVNGEVYLRRSLPALGGDLQQVGKDNFINFLGYVWDAPLSLAAHGSAVPSLPLSLAGVDRPSRRSIPINYGFSRASIPVLDVSELVAVGEPQASPADLGRAVEGRVVLVGNAHLKARNTVDIPGHIDVPLSLVQIYAAETLKAGFTGHLGGLAVLAACIVALCASLTAPLRRWSGLVFGLLAVGLLALIPVAAFLGTRVDVAASVSFLVMYWAFRTRTNWKSRLNLVDAATDLPTFAALEADKSVSLTGPTIVVGKIHRFEDVKRTLPGHLHSEYLRRVIERLQLNGEDQTFYLGHGHYLAWCIPERDPLVLRDHLEGLRALLAAPLPVGGELVDASMTFGVDATPSPDVAKRLAAAMAAVELTAEAHNPIAMTQAESDEDLLWNISLQARIDAALANGEIYLVYQPKMLVETGDMIGVEALVRWNDPKRGHIPPDLFIRQCESAGRMLHLTRFVLSEACKAGRAFEARGRILPIAVNISATLLANREVVTVVRDVLKQTAFVPSRLTLEITETYRIASLSTAQEILAELAALGPKLSMDDFGVGAASFEALLRLPFEELKIDRLFVSNLVGDAKAKGIVRHILQLGRELRIVVVAEGVENAATLAILKDLGCLVAQGYALGIPVIADQVIEFQEISTFRAMQA